MRGVLSCVSSFYDPSWFAAPVVLLAKQILQGCWRKRWTWDKHLEDDLLKSWIRWKSLLPLMTQVNIPRFYSIEDHTEATIQFHHFCDASEVGYGTVSYLRIVYIDGSISCSFVIGKSRSTPIWSPTIPRLELQSALLAVRMDKLIQRELDLPVQETLFWTDSMITLSYIKSTTKRFQTFVANRVNEIRESSNPSQWRHCPGELNPADDGSRGLDARQFLENKQWLQGPKFLWGNDDSWPNHNLRDIPDSELEIKKEKTMCVTTIKTSSRPLLYDLLERYSSWMKLLKTIAWLRKFQSWLRNGKCLEHERLTVDDLTLSKQKVVSLVQRQSFPDEIQQL